MLKFLIGILLNIILRVQFCMIFQINLLPNC